MRKFQETVEDFRKGNTANVGLKQVQNEILDLKVASKFFIMKYMYFITVEFYPFYYHFENGFKSKHSFF